MTAASGQPILGINACRIRSGGAIAHLVSILSSADNVTDFFSQVIVWGDQSLLDQLPTHPWLATDVAPSADTPLVWQMAWEYLVLPKRMEAAQVSIAFNLSAANINRFTPAVTLHQNMLPFSRDQYRLFGWGISRAKLHLLRYLNLRSLRSSSAMIFLTEFAQRSVLRTLGERHRSTVIPLGLDSTAAPDNAVLRQKDGLDHVRTVYVSPVLPYKHQKEVVAAWQILRDEGLDISLTLIGGGAGRPASHLAKQVRRLDPAGSRLRQLPFVPHLEALDEMRQADIVIFASSCETLPLTLLEAMATGTPIVCSSSGVMPEILRDGGTYFSPQDPSSIANAISFVVRNGYESRRRAQTAMELASLYSWESCSRDTFTFLAHICATK